MPVTYTEPQIYGSTLEQSWFIGFSLTNDQTGEVKRVQKRGRINYYASVDERKAEADKYLLFLKQRLKNGWHNFTDPNTKLVNRFTPFHQALAFALEKCDVSSATRKGYRGTVGFVQTSLAKLGLKNFPVGDVEHQHILLILDDIKIRRKWSNHAYNKHAGYLCSILGRLKDWRAIKENPAVGVPTKEEVETQKYVPYTEEEKKRIREYLFIHHYRFFVNLMVLYQTGIRPKEILHLKISDVDLKAGVITIFPILERENSKTKKIRHIPINNQLMPFLLQLELHSYPEDYYVFGSPYEAGKGNKGSAKGGRSGARHPDYFKPSPVQIKRDTVTKFWNSVVMDKLNIKKHYYAAKHTGCDDKIMAGIDLDSLKEMYGHSSKLMTEKYASVLKQVRFKEIKELSPGF